MRWAGGRSYDSGSPDPAQEVHIPANSSIGSRIALALACVLLITAAPSPATAQKSLAGLRGELEARATDHRGTVGLAVVDLETGDTLSIRGQERFPTASIIKVPILVELFHQVEAGPLRLEDPLIALAADLKPGSGVLQHLSTPHRLTVADAALLMIAHSDNTASNLVIDRVGIGAVNARMDSLGLPRTRLYRKLFGSESSSIAPDSLAQYGVGVTTPVEMARLFAMIYRGVTVSPTASAAMVGMLEQQFYRESLPRYIDGATVASKTGSLSAVRNDCGIVSRDGGDFVLCVFTKDNQDRSWRLDNEGHRTIADLARIVDERLGR